MPNTNNTNSSAHLFGAAKPSFSFGNPNGTNVANRTNGTQRTNRANRSQVNTRISLDPFGDPFDDPFDDPDFDPSLYQ